MPADAATVVVQGPVALPVTGLPLHELRVGIDLAFDFEHLDVPWILRTSRSISVTPGTPEVRDDPGPDLVRAIACIGLVVTSALVDDSGRVEVRFDDETVIRSGPGSWWTLSNGRESWMTQPTGGVAIWHAAEPASVDVESSDGTVIDHDVELPLAGRTITDAWIGRRLGFSSFIGWDGSTEGRPSKPWKWYVEFSGPVEVRREGSSATIESGSAPGSASAAMASVIGCQMRRVLAVVEGSLRIELDDGAVLLAPGGSWSVSADIGRSWRGLKTGGVSYRELVERPMDEAAAGQLVDAYLEYQGTRRPDLWWSWERIRDLVEHAPETAWMVLHAAIARAPDPTVVSNLAAGALEDLLNTWGERVVGRIEEAARTEPRVVYALSGVWRSHIDEDVWERVQRIVGRT